MDQHYNEFSQSVEKQTNKQTNMMNQNSRKSLITMPEENNCANSHQGRKLEFHHSLLTASTTNKDNLSGLTLLLAYLSRAAMDCASSISKSTPLFFRASYQYISKALLILSMLLKMQL